MDEKRAFSIIDIAKRAGVSTATVSRVINHNGGYSKETEEKVRQTVDECGFTPNANAIGLRTNKSRCIGVIVPDVTNEFFAKIIQELDFYLLEHRYSLLICNSNEDYELEVSCFPEYAQAHSAMERLVKSRGCFFDGIFATNDTMALACINVLMEMGISIPGQVKVVGFDDISLTRFTSPQITTIAQDTRQMALTAGKTILKMIQKKEIKEKRTIIPVTLEVRGTT